jgi:hypothetical protein
MPPLDLSIIQSLLLNLVIPSVLVGILFSTAAYSSTKSENLRSIAASFAFLASLFAGNFRNDLVPNIAIHFATVSNDQPATETVQNTSRVWEFETGWYSLLTVAVIAVMAETFSNCWLRYKSFSLRLTAILVAAVCIIISIWITPWDLLSSKPWTGFLMAAVIMCNTISLRHVGRTPLGYAVPLMIAVIWGGSAIAVSVLSHSARFADLAMLLSCALGAVGIVNFIARQRATSFYAGPSTFIPGLMLACALNTYSDIPMASYILIALAPACLVVMRIPKLHAGTGFRLFVMIIALMIPCATAVGLAVQAELK